MHGDQAEEWAADKNDGLLPSDVLAGSDKEVWWRCKYGHEWIARIANRKRNRKCPYCSGKRIIAGVNDLAATHPLLLSEWDYDKNLIKPTEVSKGSEKRFGGDARKIIHGKLLSIAELPVTSALIVLIN